MDPYQPYLRANQQLWEEWADINFRSSSYDVANFKATPDALRPLIREGVGDVAGKSLLHLQCHFGKDTLRWALLGATVTGIDFSAKAIAYAQQLATEMSIPATFIQTDLYALPQVLHEQFDVVFTSDGVLGWLPDLERWGEIVGMFLKPGGVFFLLDAHPTLLIFDDTQPVELRVKYPYFHQPEPLVFAPHVGTYADPNAVVTKTEYAWQHSLADIVNPLLRAGLRLDYLREYSYVSWQALSFLVSDADGDWRLPPEYPSLPLSFALRAVKGEK
jgi:SAM-dependent methyltransferase